MNGANSLNIVYLLIGALAGLTTIVVGLRSIIKRAKSEVTKAVTPLAEASARLEQVIGRGRDSGLAFDVDQYTAVEAANKALRSVISDSTKQLSESAAELARGREITSQLRSELQAALEDKERLRHRIETLEREVKELRVKLDYFTNPPA